MKPDGRINRFPEQFFRGLLRHLFDFHAPLGTREERGTPAVPVHQQAQIQFLVDPRAFLNQQPPHLSAFRPGLMRHQGFPDEFPRQGRHLLALFGDFDAAGLTPAPGVNLGLDHVDRYIQGRSPLFSGTRSLHVLAARHRHPELRKQLFRLKFMDIHDSPLEEKD